MDIAKMLMKNLPDGALDSVAGAAGVDTSMIGNILGEAGPSIAGAMGQKISEDEGFLEKAMGAVSGGGVMNMLLGSQVENIAEQVAGKFGISSGIVKTVLEKVMPYILDGIKSGKISPEMLTAAAGLADGIDMSDIKNIAGAMMGGGKKSSGGMLGGMLGGLLGK